MLRRFDNNSQKPNLPTVKKVNNGDCNVVCETNHRFRDRPL